MVSHLKKPKEENDRNCDSSLSLWCLLPAAILNWSKSLIIDHLKSKTAQRGGRLFSLSDASCRLLSWIDLTGKSGVVPHPNQTLVVSRRRFVPTGCDLHPLCTQLQYICIVFSCISNFNTFACIQCIVFSLFAILSACHLDSSASSREELLNKERDFKAKMLSTAIFLSVWYLISDITNKI